MASTVIYGDPVLKGGSAICMARVLGADGAAIQQADISSIAYTIYELPDVRRPDVRNVVDGHEAQSQTVASVVYDSLQTGDPWSEDSTGYNYLWAVPISSDAAFPRAGTVYEIDVDLTPASGQLIKLRFRVQAL